MISRIAAGVPAEALRQRPDVRAAEHALEAAFARTQSAKRAQLPSLNLSGSIGIDALKAGNIFSPEAAIASILAGLATPVIDAGRIRQNIRAVNSRERQVLIAYEATVLNALAEIENALAAVRRYAEQHRIVLKAAAAAHEAVTLAAWQYEAGQVDLLVSLDAQRKLLTLEQQEVTTTAQSANACVQLYQALGGGWSPF
jgi:outer membrane protein TolC